MSLVGQKGKNCEKPHTYKEKKRFMRSEYLWKIFMKMSSLFSAKNIQ